MKIKHNRIDKDIKHIIVIYGILAFVIAAMWITFHLYSNNIIFPVERYSNSNETLLTQTERD